MSLPITAVGPLKVSTNPILTEFCAMAGPAANARAATAASDAFFIGSIPPLWILNLHHEPCYRDQDRGFDFRQLDKSLDLYREFRELCAAVYCRVMLKQAGPIWQKAQKTQYSAPSPPRSRARGTPAQSAGPAS